MQGDGLHDLDFVHSHEAATIHSQASSAGSEIPVDGESPAVSKFTDTGATTQTLSVSNNIPDSNEVSLIKMLTISMILKSSFFF